MFLYTDKYLLLAKPIVLAYQNYIELKLDFASLLRYSVCCVPFSAVSKLMVCT